MLGKTQGKKGSLYTVGRNVNWYSPCGSQYRGFGKKVKIELLYDTTLGHITKAM
jgi:hypothetical protein